jgi:hypothetical protein
MRPAANGGGPGQPPPPAPVQALGAEGSWGWISYTEVTGQPVFDPLRNSRFGWQLVRRGALFLLLSFAAELVIFIFLLLVSAAARSLAPLAIEPVISTLLGIALLALYLFLPVPGLLAQWSRLLGFRAAAADTAFGHIREAMESHATPNDSLQPRRLAPPGHGVRNYLELRRGVFSGFISCFQHGNDLYVGWTFWIYMSPMRLFIMKIGRQFQDWTGRGNDMYQTLRYESTRATIAAMHACTLEGVEAAVRALEPDPGSGAGGVTDVSAG